LRAEVMVHQRRVDARILGDGSDRSLVDPIARKQVTRGLQDAITCVRRSGWTSGTLAFDVGGQCGYGVLRRSVAAARHSATTAKPTTTAMSRTAMNVGSEYAPTCCSASRA